MAVQARLDVSTLKLIKGGQSVVKSATILQDVARTTILEQYTVMAYDTSNNKWVPFNSLTDGNGGSVPAGIYLGDDIAAADLVAGDISDALILIGGGCMVDENLVVFDDGTLSKNSIILAAIAGSTPYYVISAEACLRSFGIYLQDTDDISGYEN